ncbi:hypothetical protein OUZ56_032051 [Daphnia magna]|uniref:Uncharacterized protein n=1 Tax=Daphnia magna TaxID=35525 RepID=A0ABQ9ZW27_9CRUS|nr:hypothetical protein OUZ56_032051 [Daphnia magna]
MAQEGIELVFEKPHSNIFPTMDQSHVVETISGFTIFHADFVSVWRCDCTICGGPDLVFRTQRIELSEIRRKSVSSNLHINHINTDKHQHPTKRKNTENTHPMVQYPAQKSEHRFNFLKPPIGGIAACAQCCQYRWHMCRGSDCDAVDQCSIPDTELRNHNYLTPHLESNIDLQRHTQKRYTYAIDNDINVHRQLKHKLNCFDLPNPALTRPSPRLTSPIKKYKQKPHYLANIGGREGRQGDEHIGQGWVLRFKASNRSGHFCNPQGDVFLKNDSWKCWILAV